MLTTLIITLSSFVGAATDIYANSTNPIQNAVNSANPGDVIIVEPGTYAENVVITKNDLLIRSSAGPTSTVIAANNSNLNVITIQNSNNVTIQGLNVTGAGLDKSGIYVYGSINCKVEDNILHDDALGIYLKTSDYTVVRNNTATKNLLAGVGRAISIEQSNYTTVLNNKASNHKYGIYVYDSTANTLSGNTVNQSTANGIVLDNATNVTLENNNANSNANFGIYLSNSGRNFLRSNTVFNSTNGINLVFSSGNEISGNTISDKAIYTGSHAIFLNTSHNNVLRSNSVLKNDYGIGMRYSNNNSVVNNIASNNNRGIFIAYTSSLNTLSGNQANSNTNGGIVLDNCGNNNVVNNTARLNIGTSASTGIILGGASNNNLTNNIASENRRGIYITSLSSGNIVSSNTLNSNTGHGICLENAGISNNLTSNTASSNGNYGIFLVNSNKTYILNNVAPGNTKGIYVTTSHENIVSNNTASNNINEGIMLSLSNSNNLSRNTAYNDSYGISLNSSRNNSVSSNLVTLSRSSGMFLCAQSTNNLIFNNYLNNSQNVNNNNNGSTWNITKTSGTSIAGGSYIGGNYWADPVLKNDHSQIATDADGDGIADSQYSGDNLIDYLPLVAVYVPETVLPVANFNANVTSGSAPLSVLFTDSSQNANSRSWDFGDGATSTEQNPTHSYLSPGNYTVNLIVSNLNGTDSKTAVITVLEEAEEENSGLPVADFSTNVTSGYYPLSVLFTDLSQDATSRSWDVNNDGIEDSNEASFVYTYTSTGTYTAKLTAINANGSATKTTLIAVERKSSGSSSGGGGGGSPESSRNIEVKELSQVFISNGKAVKFDFTKKATCVVYVSFDAKKTAGKTTTIAEQLKNKSSLVSELPSGEVYKSFNLWVGNSGFATSTNIENPVICFKVEKAWIQDKNIDKSSITLNRYSNKAWEQLPASLVSEDEEYLYFTAETPGFSSFVITGEANTSPEETVTEIQPVDESDNSEGNMGNPGSEADPKPVQEESSTPGFEMVYGVAGLLAVFLYKRK